MDSNLITVDCYNCNSPEHSFFTAENGFELVRCESCGLLYVRTRPNDETIDNSTAVGQHHGDKALHVDVHYNSSANSAYCKVLSDVFGNEIFSISSWLDVGCGHGEFIESVTKMNHAISICGSEPNTNKQKSARSRGLDVSYFELSEHEQRYDVVSLLNVYSHLPDPVSFIELLAGVLKPEGDLLLQTGDVAEHSPNEILRPLCLPDHLSFASERILRDILERVGFEVVSVHKYPNLSLSPRQIAKEVAKLFLRNYDSYLPYYIHWRKHSKSRMYIRARLKRKRCNL